MMNRQEAQRAHARAELERVVGDLMCVGPGLRNKSLNDAALHIGHFIGAGAIGRDECETLLIAAARKIGLPAHEARSTTRSGIDAGLREPAFAHDRVVIPFPGARVAPAPMPLPVEPEHPDIETWWLPEPLRDWVEAAHAAYAVPRIMAIAAGLCAAATVMQGKCEVEVKPGWREPISLYWLVFSPTGTLKSALMKAAAAPIRKIQATLKEDRAADLKSAQRDLIRHEAQLGRLRRAAKAHRHTPGYEDHIKDIKELENAIDALDLRESPRWLYDDVNPTMVPRVLRANLESTDGIARMAVLDAEGTFLANLLGRHSGQTNVDPLLKGYGGEPVDMVRALHGSPKLQEFNLPACHITMCILVQPHYHQLLVDEPTLGVNGLLGRCLMAQLPDQPKRPAWDAPAMPEVVQAAYEAWVASLASLPAGTVFRAPEGCEAYLMGAHTRIGDDQDENLGGRGWISRSLGRLCRIMAIVGACPTVTVSHCPPGVGVGGEAGARDEYISIFKYILSPLYLQQLGDSRAAEPTSPTLSAATPLLVGQLDSWTVGTVVTLRAFQRRLHVSKNKALELADELVALGYFEQVNSVIRHNKTVSVQYRVLAHAGERSEPVGFESLRAEYTDSPAHDRLSQSCKDWWSGKPDDDASERAAIQDESD